MLKIRLKRAGGRNHPFYRVVVIDSRKARDSRAVEEIGYYNPLEKPTVFNVNRERVDYWTSRGAQITDSVKSLLRQENTVHVAKRATAVFEPAVAAAPEAKTAKAEAAVAEAEPAAETATQTEAEPAVETEAEPTAAEAEAKPDIAPEPETAPEAQGEAQPAPQTEAKPTAADEKKDDA